MRSKQLPSVVQSFRRVCSLPSPPVALPCCSAHACGVVWRAVDMPGRRVAAHLRACLHGSLTWWRCGTRRLERLRMSGNIVCVSIERSVELIVAMIAIQLAGLVYCPVHVSLPTARKAELYTQTECSVVLTLSKHSDDVTQAVDAASTVAAASTVVTSVCDDALLSSSRADSLDSTG